MSKTNCEACEHEALKGKKTYIISHTCGKDMPIEKRMMNQIIDNIKLSSKPIFMPKEKTDWVERFDLEFMELFQMYHGKITVREWDKIKSFIETLLKEEKEKQKQEILDKIDLEKLAEFEHEQWCEWSKTIADNENISERRLGRWKYCWVPYRDLYESDKDDDRKWAEKVKKEITKLINNL